MLFTYVCENIVGLYVEFIVKAFLGIFRQFYISPACLILVTCEVKFTLLAQDGEF